MLLRGGARLRLWLPWSRCRLRLGLFEFLYLKFEAVSFTSEPFDAVFECFYSIIPLGNNVFLPLLACLLLLEALFHRLQLCLHPLDVLVLLSHDILRVSPALFFPLESLFQV